MYALGDNLAAQSCYEKGLAIFENNYGKDHPDIAATLLNLGVVLKEMGELKKGHVFVWSEHCRSPRANWETITF
jgi:hypothetical protein